MKPKIKPPLYSVKPRSRVRLTVEVEFETDSAPSCREEGLLCDAVDKAIERFKLKGLDVLTHSFTSSTLVKFQPGEFAPRQS